MKFAIETKYDVQSVETRRPSGLACRERRAARPAGRDGRPRGENDKPWAYDGLSRSPIGVTIETETAGGNPYAGRVQLGVWVSSWCKRIRSICGDDHDILPLPVILVVDNKWNLRWAVAKPDRIVS